MQNPANIQVPSQSNIDTSKMSVVSRIENVFLHQFATQKVRQLVDVTRCEILQQISVEGTQVPTYYLKLGLFVQPLEHCIFVHAKFQNLVTFVFENSQNQNAIYLLSIEVFNPELNHFCNSLRESAHVVDYKSDSYEKTALKQKMDLICGGDLTQEMIEDIEYVGPILKTVGSVLGSVSKSVVNPAAKAETIMTNSIHLLQERIVTGQNKERWNAVKQTASTWNQKMTEIYRPIDDAFKLISSAISDTFNNSENKYIKTIKKFGIATASTLNNSYKKAEQQVVGNANNNNNISISNENQNPYALNESHEVSQQNLK